jgi:D-amino-acid dehydrogenase
MIWSDVLADFLVLGAGMVGVSSALALQARGHDVVLVDQQQAGCETSYGNAGIIQAEAVEPYAMPRDFKTLSQFAIGRSNDVHWRLSGLTSMSSVLLSYFNHSQKRKHKRLSQTYSQLIACATSDHQKLIETSNSQTLISKQGFSLLYRDEQEFHAGIREASYLQQEYGVLSKVFDGQEYCRQEPALLQEPAGVVHYSDCWSCSSPGDLTKAYCRLFVARGGRFCQGDATRLKAFNSGWEMVTEDGKIQAEQVVVALGPWSPAFLKSFGYSIPMIYKRGYHGHFASSKPLNRPFLDVSNGIVASSMKDGIRLTTGASLVKQNAPIETSQLDYGSSALSELLPLGERVQEPQWFGTRPCMPDMLPVVGQAPKHKNMWFHFGHGHQGFTLGPTTSELLIQAIEKQSNPLLDALSPKRF